MSGVTIRRWDGRRGLALFPLVLRDSADLNIPTDWAFRRTVEFVEAAADPRNLFLAAERDGHLEGFLILTRGQKHSDEHVATLRIHVGFDLRGQGVGSQLMAQALAWADMEGVTRIVATPYMADEEYDPQAPPMSKHTFFERFGFEYEGRMRQAAALRDGGHTDVALLARVR